MNAINYQSGMAAVNGIELYYELYGTGEPLVLVHGGGSSGFFDFEETVKRFQEHYRLILIDLQNHGRSGHRSIPETFEQDAHDIVALLDFLDIGKASFFGFSNGATTVLKLATLFPSRVVQLIVASGNTRREGLIDGFFYNMLAATIDHMPAYLRNNFMKLNPDPELFRNMYEKDSQRMIAFSDFEAGSLERIECPVFLLCGDRDVVKVAHFSEMHQQIPGSRLMILPAGHGDYMMADAEGAVNTALIDFTMTRIRQFLDAAV